MYRYAVYELEFVAPDGSGRMESKIVFMLYAPDVCDSRDKFVYASTKDNLRKRIQPFNKEY